MTDEQLRELVRQSIERHLGRADAQPPMPVQRPRHASHHLLPVVTGAAGDGPCLIEPAVLCNHCGYCQSYGH
jgi:hypothetical protein